MVNFLILLLSTAILAGTTGYFAWRAFDLEAQHFAMLTSMPTESSALYLQEHAWFWRVGSGLGSGAIEATATVKWSSGKRVSYEASASSIREAMSRLVEMIEADKKCGCR